MPTPKDVFGSKGEKVQPSENEAEREARTDYVKEASETDKDPVPTTPPDWAKDIGPSSTSSSKP